MMRLHPRLVRLTRLAILSVAVPLALAPRVGAAVTIATVPIGNPGNANDPNTGGLYGGVADNYSIGKYDVTVGQYTAFLNAVAATDTYGLYNSNMTTANVAGIAQNGTPGSYTYSVIGSANRPITYVSWGDSARFANWLAKGQPTGAQGAGTTETGSYSLNGAVTDAALNAVSRNAGATWFIPTESEWYKAAYYDPRTAVQGGPPSDAHYWKYATRTDAPPTSAPPGGTSDTANYYDSTTGFAVTGSSSYSPTQNYLTDVGAYSASASPYGTFDQTGEVFQWNETLITGGDSWRGLRGGSWEDDASYLAATFRNDTYVYVISPLSEAANIGFRVGSVPEPSTLVLAALGFTALAARHRPAGSAMRATSSGAGRRRA